MAWYYILGIISYGIFLVQFLLSNIGIGDTDFDVDFDGEADFDASDLLSFKGLIHFAMGFSGWLMVAGKVTVASLAAASVIGFLFMVILYYAYKVCMKFNSEPTVKLGKDLIGTTVKVGCPYPNGQCLCYLPDCTEITCKVDREVRIGEVLKIDSFESGIYHVS